MSIPGIWHGFIEGIGDGTGMADSLLHVHAGLAVLILARVVTGRSLGSFVPLSIVALAEAGNEILDRLFFGGWRWPDTLSDIANTMFWPTVICIAVRWRPMMRQRRWRR